MSLLEDINARIAEDEIHLDIDYDLDAERVHFEISDTTRWAVINEVVLRRGDEYVKVVYLEGATEMQEDTPHEAEAFTVVPKEVTVVEYVVPSA